MMGSTAPFHSQKKKTAKTTKEAINEMRTGTEFQS